MSIFQKHLQDSRRRLLFPTRASADDVVLSPYCIEVIDELVTKRQGTNDSGLLAFGVLNVNAGEVAYSLDSIAPNYGKARYLYTRNESGDTSFQRQWVDLVSLENLTEQYRGGDVIGTLPVSSIPIVSRAAAVYYDVNRGNMIEFGPIPQGSVAYDFIYEVATNRPTTKQSQGFTLEQFDSLVAAKTAFKALLHCQWRGLTRKEAREQRDEIRQHLLYEIGDVNERRGLEYLYWQFNLTSFQKTSDTTTGFLQGKVY